MATEPSNSLQILMVIDADASDRLGSLVQHLCVGMVDEPVRVTVLSLSSSDGAGDWIGPSRVVRLPRRWWSWRSPSADDVLDALDIDPPDVVHCISPAHSASVRAWADAWESSLVVHLSDLRDVAQFCAMRLAGRAVALAATKRLRQALLRGRPEMQGMSYLIPHGLPAEAEPACLARPERIPAVLVTTTLTRESGLDGVFAALQSIVKGGQELQLFVLSAGPAEPHFRRQIDQLGIRSCVTFAGPLRDWATLQDAMRGADYFVLPGGQRRFTMHTLTAMASGLVVIAPNGTVEDYLLDGSTACLYDPSDADQFRRKWAAILEDRSSARELAHGALDYVRTHHQASNMVSAVATAYRESCRLAPSSGRA